MRIVQRQPEAGMLKCEVIFERVLRFGSLFTKFFNPPVRGMEIIPALGAGLNHQTYIFPASFFFQYFPAIHKADITLFASISSGNEIASLKPPKCGPL